MTGLANSETFAAIISFMNTSHAIAAYLNAINTCQERITSSLVTQNGGGKMSKYTQELYNKVNGKGFFRSFYGECPSCGKRLFSINDIVKDNKIKALFICPECNRKYKETVYSEDMKKYKYMQSIVYDYKDQKKGNVKVLRIKDRMFLVTPDRILTKRR